MNTDLINGGNGLATSLTSLVQNIGVAIVFLIFVIALFRSKGAIAAILSALVCVAFGYWIIKVGGISSVAHLIDLTIKNIFK